MHAYKKLDTIRVIDGKEYITGNNFREKYRLFN